MADIANLVLAVDSTQVARGTAALDGLTAAGTRAEAATAGLAGGIKGAGAEATAMAAAAQASARAVMGQAAGFGAATEAARLNTIAMRETLVVAREIARGNFTRIPGSLSLLAQGIGSQGGIGAFASAIAQQLGLIKTVQNAELAEAAAAAASATASVEAAARKAAANVMAADTEIALAEAQLRVTEGTSAEAAAQVRLAEAHQAVAAAAAEAAVAEDALAVAMGRSNEAQAASAAASRTVIGGTGVGLLGIATVAAIAWGAIKRFQDQVKDSGVLDRYAESSRLTAAQIKKLGGTVDYLSHSTREVTGLTVTFGDVMEGVWKEVEREAENSSGGMRLSAGSAFSGILDIWNKTSAAISAGFYTLGDIAKDVFQYIAQQIGAGFYSGVNKAIDAVNSLNERIPKWAGGGDPHLIPHLKPDGSVSTLPGLGATIRSEADKNYREALAANNAAFAGVEQAAIDHRLETMRRLSDANRPPKPKKPKKKSDHGLQEALDKLQAEVKGQYDLAAAYQVSDVAAQRAVAAQKAAEDAIEHKGQKDQFYALELQKAVATDVAQASKRNADLQFETSVRARLNGEIAAGTLTIAQANDQLKIETSLRGLNADLENADAAHKQTVRDVIKQTVDLENQQLQLEAQLNALKQIASNDNDIERMRLENSLMGASNKERAVAIAQLEALQQLKEIDPNGLLTRGERNDYVQSAMNRAAAGVQTPFQQWAHDIPQTADAITEALQGIETRGFDNLAQAITGVVTGTESLGKAFSDVARSIISDIVQMTVKMLIFRALSSVFGGLFGGGGGGADIGNANLGSAIYGGGGLTGTVQGFASGGSFIIGGNGGVDNNVLSLNGSPVAMVSQGETLSVFPNRPQAANSNQPQTIELRIATDGNFKAEVAQLAGQVVITAAPTIVKQATTQTIKTLQRPKISGGR